MRVPPRKLLALGALAVVVLIPSAGTGAYFDPGNPGDPRERSVGNMAIEGLTGPSSDGSIPLVAFQWQVKSDADPGGATGSDKATFHDVTIVKTLDQTSPQLLVWTANGTLIPHVTMNLTKRDQFGNVQQLATYCLGDVAVTGVKPFDNGVVGDSPNEEVTFAFARVTETVGGVTKGWDRAHN